MTRYILIGIGREVEAKKKDGSIFPIELSVNEMNVDSSVYYTGIIRDISQKKEFEQQLQKQIQIVYDNEQKLQSVLKTILGA